MAMRPLVAATNSDLWRRVDQCLSEAEQGDRAALIRMREVIEEGVVVGAYLHDVAAYSQALERGAVTPQYMDQMAGRMKRRAERITA